MKNVSTNHKPPMPRKKQADADQPISLEEAKKKLEQAAKELLAGHDPGVISFRLKPTNKADQTYPLKLTQQQRESLICYSRIKNKLKERLKAAGEGTQTVAVYRKELEHLDNEIATAATYAPSPYKKRLVAVLHKVADLLGSDRADPPGGEKPKTRKTAPKQGGVLYQFKITLLDTEPEIWRRIQVTDCTLAELHNFIQAAMGWWNYHLHQFEIDGTLYCDPAPGGEDLGMECEDEARVRLSRVIPKSGRRTRWIYEYDLGDGWRHEILFEGFPPIDPKAKYPLCLEGERSCPPEDSGGPWGFVEYLAAIRDPNHEEHQGMLEWRGPFDAEAFDAKKATREMRRALREA